MTKFISMAEWLYELLYLQALWVIYMLRGGVVLGMFPATLSVYSVVRYWLRFRKEDNTKELFADNYKKSFVVSNQLGYLFLFISFIIIMNFSFVPMYTSELLRLGFYSILAFLAFIMILLWVFFFPVLAHFEMKQPVKRGYALAMIKTGTHSVSGFILQMLFTGIYVTLMYILPPLVIVFGIIPLALLQMVVLLNSFRANTAKVVYE